MKTGSRKKLSSRKLGTFYNWINVKTQHTQAYGNDVTGSKKHAHDTRTALSATPTPCRNHILITYL